MKRKMLNNPRLLSHKENLEEDAEIEPVITKIQRIEAEEDVLSLKSPERVKTSITIPTAAPDEKS